MAVATQETLRTTNLIASIKAPESSEILTLMRSSEAANTDHKSVLAAYEEMQADTQKA